MLVPINENKEIIKKYEELWSILRNLIRSIIKNSDDKLPPNETIEIHSMVIVVSAVFHENNKYHS